MTNTLLTPQRHFFPRHLAKHELRRLVRHLRTLLPDTKVRLLAADPMVEHRTTDFYGASRLSHGVISIDGQPLDAEVNHNGSFYADGPAPGELRYILISASGLNWSQHLYYWVNEHRSESPDLPALRALLTS